MKPIRVQPLLQLLEHDFFEFKNLIEIGAVLEGRKSVVRLVTTPTEVRNARQFFGHYYPDFFIRLSSFVLEDVFWMTSMDRFQRRIPARNGTEGERVFFVGMRSAVDEAWAIEEDDCLDDLTARLYGYPDCCGRAYHRISKGERWLEILFEAEAYFASFGLVSNRLSSLLKPWLSYHYDYFPCSATCSETLRINQQNREMLTRSDLSEFVQPADAHLAAAVILYDGCVWYVRSDAGRGSLRPGLEPVIQSDGAECPRLTGLRLSGGAASTHIDDKWRHTDAGEVRVYTFGNGEGLGAG